MTRIAAVGDHSTSTIDRFYGMVRDRSGIEIDKGEFYDLRNVHPADRQRLERRGATAPFNFETHAPGTKVNGFFTYVNDTGTETGIKICQDGNMYKHNLTPGGTWTQITASAPTFANADAWFAQLMAIDTGAAASASGTLETTDTISITDNDAAYTINAHMGRVLSVSSEKKVISANTATKVFVKERFDQTVSGAFNIYPRSQEFFVANGTDFYKCDGTTFTRLDNSVFAAAFTGITSHGQRLFGWKDTRGYWSDAGMGEHFSRNAWRDFETPIKCAAPLRKILVWYENKKVTAQFGDSPDNYRWEDVLSGVGTVAPKSVAAYNHLQFFLDDRYGVCVISAERLVPGGKLEPLSVSERYINNILLSHSASQLSNAAGGVEEGRYYLAVGNDVYVLYVQESLDAPRDEDGNIRWLWSRQTRGETLNAESRSTYNFNCFGHLGTTFVGGSFGTGQAYVVEAPYTRGTLRFNETFTEAAGTPELSTHTPDTGTSWSKVIGIIDGSSSLAAGSDLKISSANDRLSAADSTAGANDGALYTANGTYDTPDYEVQVTMTTGDTADDVNWLAVRVQDSSNLYAARFNNDSSAIWKKVSGTWTELATGAGIADASIVRLVCLGEQIWLEDDGKRIIEVRDDSITAAGKAGIGMGDIGAVTGDDVSAQELDAFSVRMINVDDDGANFTATIEKRDWQVTPEKVYKLFQMLQVAQKKQGRTVSMSYYFDPDGSTYGSALQTIALASQSRDEYDVKITTSLSDIKDRGKRMSVKIENTGAAPFSPIEELVLLYDADTLH